MFEATAFEIRFKFSMDMSRQAFSLSIKLFNQGGVVFLDKLVEQSLLWAMAFISSSNGINESLIRQLCDKSKYHFPILLNHSFSQY